jgi:RHS repeat-associated protein
LSLTGSPGRFTFNGKEYDDGYDFDLYYYGARYMDPALGRFISPDPVNDFLNPYSYVANNPLNRIDPTGMRGLPARPLVPCILPLSYETLHRLHINELLVLIKELSYQSQLERAAFLLTERIRDMSDKYGGGKIDWDALADRLADFFDLEIGGFSISLHFGKELDLGTPMQMDPGEDGSQILWVTNKILKGDWEDYKDHPIWGVEIFGEVKEEYLDIFAAYLVHEMVHSLDISEHGDISMNKKLHAESEVKAYEGMWMFLNQYGLRGDTRYHYYWRSFMNKSMDRAVNEQMKMRYPDLWEIYYWEK